MDHRTKQILAINETPKPVKINKNTCLGTAKDLDIDGMQPLPHEYMHLAVTHSESTRFALPSLSVKVHMLETTSDTAVSDDEPVEQTLENGVTIYDNPHERKMLEELVDKYPPFFRDNGLANIDESLWMTIPLRPGWEERLAGKAKIYLVGPKNRAVIDIAFDALHATDEMEYAKKHTALSFPVFVVWKYAPPKEPKSRALADNRGLNK
jgi:hypothetical protein